MRTAATMFGQLLRRRRRLRSAQKHQLGGAGDPVRGAEAGLVVLVGDVEAFELLGVGVLAHAVVVEAQVHGLRLGRPEPERDLGLVGVRLADVELGGVLLPEVAQAEGEAAAHPADVAEAGGAACRRPRRSSHGPSWCACAP